MIECFGHGNGGREEGYVRETVACPQGAPKAPGPPAFRSPRQNPWWIPPFLGGVPAGVGPAHLRVLGFVTLAMFFENYDLGMLGNALPQMAADFGLDEIATGRFAGWARLGALPAFFLLPLADRIGRRRLLLISIAGMSLGSCATAFAPTASLFVAIQIVTRSFIIAAAITSFVVVSEEFPAANRGWGIGILAGVGAIGFGFGALLYGFVNQLPFGWRSLYALGVFPALFLPALARGLRETARFAAAADGAATPPGGRLRPGLELFRRHPRHALVLALMGGLASAGMGPSFQFISDFLQTQRRWTPGSFAALSVVFGAFAIIGNPVAGRLGDRYGRRTIAAVVFALFPFASLAFFAGPAWLVALPWTAMVFLSMASSVCVRALATELFPTELRGAGGGSVVLLETVGAGFGLLIAYPFAMELLAGGQSTAIPLIAVACLGAALATWFLPETAGRELEEIAAREG